MIDLNYYERLPDYLEAEDLKKEVTALLNLFSSNGGEEYLEALYELSLRKENINLTLDELTQERIDKSVNQSWDMNSLSNTELVIMITFNFELRKSFELLKSKYSQVSVPEVRKELEECFADAKQSPPPIKNW